MSTSNRQHQTAEQRRYYKMLRSLKPTGERCGVPGCPEPHVHEDVCYPHALQRPANHDYLPNDGIIDWEAIDITVTRRRKVRLTWVETDIVVGTLLAQGETLPAARAVAGISTHGTAKIAAYERIADAIRCAA